MSETQQDKTPKKTGMLDPKANMKALVRIVLVLALLIAVGWVLIHYTLGDKAAKRLSATVLKSTIELKNAVENVPASSFKSFPLSLPYAGMLTIEAKVLKGNELDVYVVNESELEKIKAQKKFSHLQGFEASKTANYSRSVRVNAGTYYLVFIDTTLGLISKSSSDVKIHAKLDP